MRYPLEIDDALAARITDHRYARRHPTFKAAIVELLEAGLLAHGNRPVETAPKPFSADDDDDLAF